MRFINILNIFFCPMFSVIIFNNSRQMIMFKFLILRNYIIV